jgi:hypothetical protein
MSSYKPYPSTGKPVQQDRPPAPQSVQNAVKLMYAGAAVSTVSLIIPLATLGTLKSAIRSHYPHYTTSQVNHAYTQAIQQLVFYSVFAILLWLVMAWATGKGMAWARIVSTVLFAFWTIGLIPLFAQPVTIAGAVFNVLIWLIGLGAVILLWRPESSAYFKPPSDS